MDSNNHYLADYFFDVFFSHHLLAKVFESKGEFRSALRHEKERYMVYRSQVILLI